MSNSIHAAKWISAIDSNNTTKFIFPCASVSSHKNINHIPLIYHSVFRKRIGFLPKNSFKIGFIKTINILLKTLFFSNLSFLASDIRSTFKNLLFSEYTLIEALKYFKPNVINALEFQTNAYKILNIHKYLKQNKIKIVINNWGSDIYHFQNKSSHRNKIINLLKITDIYISECKRDENLARLYKFNSYSYTVPNSVGIDVKNLSYSKTSSRKIIMIKGYSNYFGRAEIAIDALLSIKKSILSKFEILIFSADVQIKKKYKNIKRINFLPIMSNEELLNLFSKARILLTASISDGLSTSSIEAISKGCFILQANTSCLSDYFQKSLSYYEYSIYDNLDLVNKIESALTDNYLVDKAASINNKIIIKNFNYDINKKLINSIFNKI